MRVPFIFGRTAHLLHMFELPNLHLHVVIVCLDFSYRFGRLVVWLHVFLVYTTRTNGAVIRHPLQSMKGGMSK